MPMTEARRIRAAVTRHQGARPHPNKRFPVSLRARATAYARRRRARGVAFTAIAAELGLSVMTVQRWLRRRRRGPFRRVEVRSAAEAVRPSPASAVLVTPRGYRVEGLALTALAELLRVLA